MLRKPHMQASGLLVELAVAAWDIKDVNTMHELNCSNIHARFSPKSGSVEFATSRNPW